MLVDSDVLIWYLRGEARAAEFLARIAQPRRLLLADALIGATALEYALPLATGNAKHFAAIEELTIHTFAR